MAAFNPLPLLFVNVLALNTDAAVITKQPFYPNHGYDLGPLDKCVKVPRPIACPNYRNKTLTPAYAVYSGTSDHKFSNEFLDAFQKVENALVKCAREVYLSMCSEIPALQNAVCLANNRVKLVSSASAFVQMFQALSRCFKFSKRLTWVTSLITNSLFQFPFKLTTYSLTKCRKVNLPGCPENPHGSTAPEWLAVITERSFAIVTKAIKSLSLIPWHIDTSQCQEVLLRFYCTHPTCTKAGHLEAYRTQQMCNNLMKDYIACFAGKGEGSSLVNSFINSFGPTAIEIVSKLICDSSFPDEKLMKNEENVFK
eukprot:m.32654 g.32654  ORF g.32654 m.32654 type:complete len:311 (+) comp31678_c0_seq1:35-967(+)